MEFDCNYDFHKVVEEVLDEYEFDYEYKEEDDLYFSGVNYDDLGNVSLLIMNAGSRITLVGEVDYAIENELVYQRASDFVHRFNSMDCISTLFLDPEKEVNIYILRRILVLLIVLTLNLHLHVIFSVLHWKWICLVKQLWVFYLVYCQI